MMKSSKKLRVVLVLIGLFYFIVSFLVEAANWLQTTWDDISFATVVYQLSTPLKGTNSDIIVDFCTTVFTAAVIKTAVVCVLYYALVKIFAQLYIKFDFQLFSKSFSLSAGKKFQQVGKIVFLVLLVFFSYQSIYGKVKELGIDSYVKSIQESSTIFEDYYVKPDSVDIKFPEKKRNLLFIYLESMETTYASVEDGGAKADNYMPELTHLAEEYVSISNTDKIGGGYPCALTGWTMAALLGSTSGVPYKIPGDGNSGDRYAQILPGLVTLGDILLDNGYTNYFLCGSDGEFAGRKTYFEQHGEYEMRDYYYALDQGYIPEDYFVFWGYEDERLFDIAKKNLTEIASRGELFNYTMLTVDTHHNEGYVCELCDETQFDERFANVIACSSRQTYDFISWVQQQDWYENTTIILVGDHNSMTSDFWDDIGDFDRRTYNCFINLPDGIDTDHIKFREFTTLDMFPTTLAAMGVNIEGNRLGLGTNLFSEQKTLMEELGKDKLNSELSKYSKYYNDEFVIGN